MKLEANQQFFTNNWQEFVHLQYLIDALRLVPNVITENDKQQTVDEFKITTDKNGENPIEILGTDSEGNQTVIHLKPEITDRVNELIRQNIHVLIDDEEKSWERINLVKNTEHNCFEVSAKLNDGSTVDTTIPNMTTEDLKQINTIRAYPNKIAIKFLEENTEGQLEEKERVYDFDLYLTKSEYEIKMEQIDNTLANIGEVHQLSDKACEYLCVNHGLTGYNIIYNLGETTHQLVNFDVDFQGCLNASLIPGQEWQVECIPTDLTTSTEYNVEKTPVPCQIVMEYKDGTIKHLDATCALTKFTFTVPDDAVRGKIKHARFSGILYFD